MRQRTVLGLKKLRSKSIVGYKGEIQIKRHATYYELKPILLHSIANAFHSMLASLLFTSIELDLI